MRLISFLLSMQITNPTETYTLSLHDALPIFYAEIVEWAVDTIKQARIPCLHVYAAGKAQEVVRLFNVYTHLPVIVNPRLDGVNEAHQKSGVALDWFSASSRDGKTIIDKDPCVYFSTHTYRSQL